MLSLIRYTWCLKLFSLLPTPAPAIHCLKYCIRVFIPCETFLWLCVSKTEAITTRKLSWCLLYLYDCHSASMMTSSSGNFFRVTGPLCGDFTGHRWILRTEASDAELWCFLWPMPWINDWVNNREAGDLRRHRAHYDVIVMSAAP